MSHWQDWDGAKGNLAFELVGGILVLKPTAKLLVTYAPFSPSAWLTASSTPSASCRAAPPRPGGGAAEAEQVLDPLGPLYTML